MLRRWIPALAMASLCSCAPAEEWAEPGANQEVHLATIDPKAKVGTFELDRLYGDTSFMGFDFRLGGHPVVPGSRQEMAIGSYRVLGGALASFADGSLPGQGVAVAITEGTTTTQPIAGLRVRYDEPVTMGASYVRIASRATGAQGSFLARGAWSRRSNGAGMMLLPEEIMFSNDAELTRYFKLDPGRITEVVLPTVEIRTSLDSYDPSYPDYSSCETVKFFAGSVAGRESRSVRNRDGSSAAKVVAPAGPNAKVTLRVYGAEFVYPTEHESTIWLELSRVEVNDMEVPGPSGSIRVVGTYKIEYQKADGAYAALSCTLRTHTGVDLPAGHYRITTTAHTPSGATYTDVQNITLY